MKVWQREENGVKYEVVEVPFDGDLHEFTVVEYDSENTGDVLATISPVDLEDQERIIKDLDNGNGVDGWEDGMGNTISI
ncbi:hypothetical protein [Oceanobacillus neutriphilus]|uniref:DUF1292 domain-containing protein n=1 Tax=Oceanobacillus neutriphilus TaxID=531815 RepID=A0ABQ2NZB0_9BACI|nr:hypothetical protein [Oceanobacillus neutriphilus]GGP14218.1 hypothetical protein GCM10011346_37460 [Oceanobacillus neutriphilus]